MQIENRLVRESIHDPRYDRPYFEPIEEETEERKFEDGEIASSEEYGEVKILSASWDYGIDGWMYECEPTDPKSEYAWAEIAEGGLK